MRKGGHGRKGSIAQLVALLDDDAEVKQATNGNPLNLDTVKHWIDTDGPKLAAEAVLNTDQANGDESEKVSGGATKAQLDWKELLDRYATWTEPKDGEVIKRRKGNCGDASVEEAQEEPEPSPAPDQGDADALKISNKRARADGGDLEGFVAALGGFFDSYKAACRVRAQADADEAVAKRLEAEAKRDEARAKLLQAQRDSEMQLINQIERLTAMAEAAERNGSAATAKTYRAKIDKLSQQLLDS